MNDERFEAWWPRNPARLEMNPVAKEVARGIWRAAREDMLAEMQAVVTRSPDTCWQPIDTAPCGEIWITNGKDETRVHCAITIGGGRIFDHGSQYDERMFPENFGPATHWRPVTDGS